LKEQILQADQTYSSALEGMKMEISQLTRELHQRDITIASAKCSSSDMEKQLKAEMQKAEEKAVEHKVKSIQGAPLHIYLFVFKE
jgi:centrosomal protein CEP63